ncbi:MAG: hypothetical protein MOGMAGMI_00091 [Candidatus Omnitrophica bacterium]|nr:hypothetical protein [Candidatus Omnitrophota bacterium]
MAGVTQVDLDGLARKRRVQSLHKWFRVLQRSVNLPTMPEGEDPRGFLRVS